MPILELLAGAAVLLGAFKGVSAFSDNCRAQKVQAEALDVYQTARRRLESARERTASKLSELGQLKLTVWSGPLGRFAETYDHIHRFRLTGEVASETVGTALTRADLSKMKDLSLKASEALPAALGSGALTTMAAYGGTALLGTASTGTAIGTLSGAAATDATLAWLGGGSLATGGAGMAGGMAVLGGLVLGPALAVGGMLLADQAAKHLSEAEEDLRKARQAAQEMEQARRNLIEIGRAADRLTEHIAALVPELDLEVDRLESLVREKSSDIPAWRFVVERWLGRWIDLSRIRFDKLTPSEQSTVLSVLQVASHVRNAVETPLLTKDGSLSSECEALLRQLSNPPEGDMVYIGSGS